jgi:hypothetical protein
MKASRGWLGLPVVVLLAACPGETREGDVALRDDTIAPPAEVVTPPAGQVMTERAEFQELQGSGVSGEVMVTDRGNQTEVMVRLSGAPANSTLPGHIHSGSCENIGGVQQPLDSIDTDATGAGTTTTTVGVPPMTAMDGQHIVVYHGEGGTPIACAPIPAHRM